MSDNNSSLAVQDGETVVFIGDSITDCDRSSLARPLGNGYVRMVVDQIKDRYPDRNIKYVNRGIGGDVVVGLRQRWEKDVLAHKPDWVSMMIGINDIHNRLESSPGGVLPDEYREAYSDCLRWTAEQSQARIILMDPFYIMAQAEPDSLSQSVLNILPDYIEVVHELAERFNAIHVPLHDIFQKLIEHDQPEKFCPEPVHPNPAGHKVIAQAWLDAMEENQ